MKPGDLAIQIISQSGNEGKIVTLIRHEGTIFYCDLVARDAWLVDYGKIINTKFCGKFVKSGPLKNCPTAWLRILPPPEKEVAEEKENELSRRD